MCRSYDEIGHFHSELFIFDLQWRQFLRPIWKNHLVLMCYYDTALWAYGRKYGIRMMQSTMETNTSLF